MEEEEEEDEGILVIQAGLYWYLLQMGEVPRSLNNVKEDCGFNKRS